jgi:ABC-type transport system involved in multi-copper enzyme maturation permease subunit
MFSSFGYYGIAVLLSIRQKLQWKALYESVILSLGIIVILCSMFSLLVE